MKGRGWIWGLGVFLVDQITKALALVHLSEGGKIALLPGVVDLVLVKNRGIAFGGLAQSSSLAISFLSMAVVVMVYIFWRGHSNFLPLIIGGAMGNIVDRLRLGYVVDFIALRSWPVFNIADMCIVGGVLLTLLALLLKGGGKDVPDTI